MSSSFTGSEIVEIAIQIEINGRDFYKKVAETTDDQAAKEVFLSLAKEEDDHIVSFKKLLDSVNKYEPEGAYPEEYFSYMNTLAEGHVFTAERTATEIAETMVRAIDAIVLGITLEEESILYYEEMKKIVSDKDRPVLEQLIEQEKEHLQKLLDLKDRI